MSGQHRSEHRGENIPFKALASTDRYIDELHITGGSPDDQLAVLFAEFKEQTSRNIPRPPTLEELGIDSLDGADAQGLPSQAAGLSSHASDESESSEGGSSVTSMARWRRKKEKSRAIPAWAYALGGAAAACVIIAGGGAAIHASQPGDPLWGLNTALFGDHANVVELTSTLDQAEERQKAGDTQGALALLQKARNIADHAKDSKSDRNAPKTTTVTVTDQQTIPTPGSGQQPTDPTSQRRTTTTQEQAPQTAEPNTTVTVTSTVDPTQEPTSTATPAPATTDSATSVVPRDLGTPTAEQNSAPTSD